MERKHTFSSLMLMMSASAAMSSVQFLFSLGENSPGIYHMMLLIPFGALLFLINSLLLKKERTINFLTIVNAVVTALLLAGLFFTFGFGGGKQVFVTLCFYALTAGLCVNVVLHSPRQNHLILALDGNILLLVALMLVISVMDAEILWCCTSVVGVLCGLLGLMERRMGQGRGWMISAALLTGAFGTMLLLLRFAERTGQGILAVFQRFAAGIRYLGLQIERFLLYLTSFMEQETYGELEAETFGIPAGDMATAQSFQNGMGIAIAIIICLFVLFLVFMFLRILGRQKLGRRRVKGGVQEPKRRPSFFRACRIAIKQVWEKLILRIEVRKRRNEVWGLYYTLVRLCGRSSLCLRDGESPREFLRRLQSKVPELQGEFESLIPQVDAALFGLRGKSGLVQDAPKVRKMVRKMVLAQKLQYNRQNTLRR